MTRRPYNREINAEKKGVVSGKTKKNRERLNSKDGSESYLQTDRQTNK